LVPAIILLLLVYAYLRQIQGRYVNVARPAEEWTPQGENASFWRNVPTHYPPPFIRPLPTGSAVRFPRVQAAEFPAERQQDARVCNRERQQAVKLVFAKHWRAFRERAWGTGVPALGSGVLGHYNHDSDGWGSTLLAALDTLWIMDMKDEFSEAVAAAVTIDFTPNPAIDTVFVSGTTTGFLAGFLSAYDLSGDVRLLRKAVEVGDMLYKAFDTPTRMPIIFWGPHAAASGKKQVAKRREYISSIGDLSLEFTRLSMLTGDAKWFDAVQRVTGELAAHQNSGRAPGLWSWYADLQKMNFHVDGSFSVPIITGTFAKTAALVGGRLPVYRTMYEKAIEAATMLNLFTPMTPTNEDVLMAGQFTSEGSRGGETVVGQDSCDLGASMALGGRLFDREQDGNAARRLVDGCIWVCKAWSHGSMPYTSFLVACPSTEGCPWSEEVWKREVVVKARDDLSISRAVRSGPVDAIIDAEGFPKGFTPMTRGRYALRPGAIASVFVLYRITGRPELLESAWDMFTAITSTWNPGVTGLREYDVLRRVPQAADMLDPTWMGQTLKYFYLVFSDPGLASLDDFVFNTDAHPFRRPV